MDPDELDEAARLADFLQLYRADAERGARREPEEYARRAQADAAAVARECAALDAGRDAAHGPQGGSASLSDAERTALPGYLLLRELGRGGQGAVYLAQDLELPRLVALKVLRSPLGVPSAARRARLRREVSLLARLDHPGICAVYRAHLDHEPPFVAMRYVPGPTVAELLAMAPARAGVGAAEDHLSCVPRDRAQLERLLAFFEQAARALHAAHEAGIVHRDIKPANIVAGADGRPVLLDFGLARTLDADQTLVTRTDELFGTPAYMSPEQLTQPADSLDRRTDVHSLGVTLFECLTGHRPFEAPSQRQLEQAICTQPVPRASQANRTLPADLDVVLATAMEKDLGRRYATALDLAEELRRLRENHPVLARPTGRLLRARRWSQRHPALAVAVSLLTLGAVGLLVALLLLAREAQRTRDALQASRSDNLAFSAVDTVRLDPITALAEAIASHEMSPGAHSRSALYEALRAQRCRLQLSFGSTTGRGGLAVANDLYAACGSDGTTVSWRLPEATVLCRGSVPGAVTAVAPTPDGADVVLGFADGTLRTLLGTQPWTEACRTAHEGAVRVLAFSPDGTLLATAGDDGVLRLRAAHTGRALAVVTGQGGLNCGLRFAPDGRAIASWSGDVPDASGFIDCVPRLWSTEDGAARGELGGHRRHVEDVRFSADGTRVASASDEGRVRVWALPGLDCAQELDVPAKVHDLNFSPDGRRLAVAFDPELHGIAISSGAWVFDVSDGRRALDLRGHTSRAVASIDWSPDGKRLLTGGFDNTARLWSAEDGRQLDCIPGRHDLGLVTEARFGSGGEDAIIRQNAHVLVASGRGPQGPLHLARHGAAASRAAFSADGAQLASIDVEGGTLLHDVRRGALLQRLPSAGHPLLDVAFTADGTRVVTAAADGNCRILDARRGELLHEIRLGTAPVTRLRNVDRGAGLLAISGAEVALLDPASGTRRVDFRGHEADVQCLDVSPDGRLLATGAADRTVRLWDLESGACVRVLRDFIPGSRISDNKIFACKFSPDGTWLATAADDARVRAYRLDTGELAWSRGPQLRYGELLWLDGGRRLAVMPKWMGAISLMTHEAGRGDAQPNGIELLPRPGGRASAMAASPDGKRLLVAATDGRAQLWDLGDGSEWAVVGGGAPLTCAAFSPDGSCFVTAASDGEVTLWPSDPDAAAVAGRVKDWFSATAADGSVTVVSR